MNILREFSKKTLWATERPSSDKPDDGFSLARYMLAEEYVQRCRVLDIGCGSGEGANHLIKSGASAVVGVDYSQASIAHCQRTYLDDRLSFAVMDATQLDFDDGAFDVVVALEIIEHLLSPKLLLTNICHVLNSDGVAIISTPNRLVSSPDSNTPANPYHVREFLPYEFKTLLLSYFESVSCFGILLTEPKAISHVQSIQSSWRWRLASRIVRSRIVRILIEPIPPKVKQFVTGEYKVHVSANSYEASPGFVQQSQVVVAVCHKPLGNASKVWGKQTAREENPASRV